MPSIFSNNCLGAMMSHDLGLQFRSPMVNLWMYPKDYIYALANKSFFNQPVKKASPELQVNLNYPVGQIGKIAIYFMHYHSFEEAKQKWEERCLRIDWNKAYFILVERDGCTEDDLLAFDALPYQHKVALVHKPHPEIQCSYYVKGYENQECLSTMVDSNGFFGTREYDIFNWVEWLREKE